MALLLVAAGLGPRAARADGLTAAAEPMYTVTRLRLTDATGTTTTTDSQLLSQQYRLGLDKSFTEALRWRANGTLLRDQLWSETGGTSTDGTRQEWTLSTGLGWGGPVLGGSFTYDRDTVDAKSSVDAAAGGRQRTRVPTLVSETYGASARWDPVDLPVVNLRLSRANQFDETRAEFDTATTTAGVTAIYSPTDELGLTYATTYNTTDDRVDDTSTWTLGQVATATYRRRFFGDRSQAYLAYGLQSSLSETQATSALGTVRTQRPSLAGLSLVEAFPDVPSTDTLQANPALVDGNLQGSAGLDLGFQRTLAGDTAPRDVGVQMGEPLQPVNLVQVWVDRLLPDAVWRAIEWSAWRSDDNVNWVPVPLDGAVTFGPFQNRFEIPIQRTRSKYLKLVTRPLAATVTTDATLGAILVTEVVLFEEVSAESVAGRTTTVTNAVNGTVTTRLLDSPALTHDLSFRWAKTGGQSGAWVVANGLGLRQLLNPVTTLTARVARTDSSSMGRHTGQLDWGTSLGVNPVPAATAGATYAGNWAQLPEGDQLRNAASVFARADLYRGLSVTGNAGRSYTSGAATSTRTTFASATTSIVPNRVLNLSGTYGYNRSHSETGDRVREVEAQQLTGLASITPFPALLATAGATRSTQSGTSPRLLWNYLLSYAPLRGGDLVLTGQHQETSDDVADTTTKSTSASLRWNVRPNAYLDLNYSNIDNRSPQSRTRADSLMLHLFLTLS
ncbi:conserved hypothetical protein [Anaeromyxobacter dehalogenans 2CP-1]|uniref:Uncharacterized protein n=1 Tax=Anaeromyxobacter dehalogenans (strain ATCC BAA-258 / DSM 21875 / 2CP-1) TaxID=455488 RepID=B8JGW2_ANAD2|nr:hypothetical protein [Anaeromyxobacter dehalogenans]ACL66599.1 conserved hypothetical protein [Anaeromyxobacter dehalogenans 2CP-1]